MHLVGIGPDNPALDEADINRDEMIGEALRFSKEPCEESTFESNAFFGQKLFVAEGVGFIKPPRGAGGDRDRSRRRGIKNQKTASRITAATKMRTKYATSRLKPKSSVKGESKRAMIPGFSRSSIRSRYGKRRQTVRQFIRCAGGKRRVR